MQRIVSIVKQFSRISLNTPIGNASVLPSFSGLMQNRRIDALLTPNTPLFNPVCGLKVRGRLRRRCKSCFFVLRDARLHVICKEHPRHKQMAMRPKPHNTWILTHASQSPVRPW